MNNLSLTFMFLCIFFQQTAAAQEWKNLGLQSSPPPLANAAGIMDEQGQRLLLFGGLTANGPVNELWSLDLIQGQWSKITPKTSVLPKPRYTQNGMLDIKSNRLLIWSGQGEALFNDVWAFRFSDSTWEEIFPDGNVTGAPLKRYGTAAVFDPEKRRLVTFAGFTTSGRFDDTWHLAVDSGTWEQELTNMHPLKRCLHASCLSEERRQMFVFGGQSSGNLHELWSLDLDGYNWTSLSAANGPSARHFTSLLHIGGNLFVFGGNTTPQGNYSGVVNDLWKYSLNSQTWDSVSQGNVLPAARAGHVLAYNKTKDQLILFGGNIQDGSFSSETWIMEEASAGILGTATPSDEFLFEVFPNPFAESIVVRLPELQSGPVEICLYSALGVLVKKEEQHAVSFRINVSGLAPGAYLCTATDGRWRAHKMLVKR